MAKVAKKKSFSISDVSAASNRAEGLAFKLSPAREEELVRKIGEAAKYYERTFSVALTPQDIFDMLQKVVDRDKERLFLNKVGNVSEADILWFGARNGLFEGAVNGTEQGGEGEAKGVSSEVQGGGEADPFGD